MGNENKVKLGTTVTPLTMELLKSDPEQTPGQMVDSLAFLFLQDIPEDVAEALTVFCKEEKEKREQAIAELKQKRANGTLIEKCSQSEIWLDLYARWFEGKLPWEKVRDKYFNRIDLADGDYALIRKKDTVLFPDACAKAHHMYMLTTNYLPILKAKTHNVGFIMPTETPLVASPETQKEIEDEIIRIWPEYAQIRKEALEHQDAVVMRKFEFVWPLNPHNDQLIWEYDELEEHEGSEDSCTVDMSQVIRRAH